ncbi:MAG: DUF4367 domain-containing protein [Blautia sp.]
MGKITEKNNRIQTLSAQDQYDENFNGEYSPEDMEEAVLIEREIRDIPDKEEWEPTEEQFQVLLAKARERGLIIEKENTIPMADSQKNQSKTKKKMYKTKKIAIRKRVMKWSAVAAAAVIGIFGVSMSSEANRAYIMQKVSTMLHNDTKTKVNNVDVMESKDGEETAKEEIESAFGIEMPTFFYMPDGMVYDTYVIDEESQMASIQFSYEGKLIYFTVLFNLKEAASIMKSDLGNEESRISSALIPNLDVILYEIMEDGDNEPTYILQWQYKNTYYELFGKMPKKEMVKIAEKILY